MQKMVLSQQNALPLNKLLQRRPGLSFTLLNRLIIVVDLELRRLVSRSRGKAHACVSRRRRPRVFSIGSC